nr:MAG TPA: minor capsid protein [Caudoviricetes sp.]
MLAALAAAHNAASKSRNGAAAAIAEAASANAPRLDETAQKAAEKRVRDIAGYAAKGVSDALARQNLSMAETAARAWREAAAKAALDSLAGNLPQDAAIERAYRELGGSFRVQHASGRRDSVDVALRRMMATELSQASGRATLANLDAAGWQLAHTDAHYGARPSHAEGQGKPFGVNGPVVVDGVEYPGMAELTGYGTATGLKGVNCRHTIEVYVPGETEPPDTEFKEDSALHNGMTSEEYYEAVQRQRALERAVRGTRYQVAMMEKMGMGLEHPSYVQKRLELGNWQAKLAKHCKANNLTRIPSREQAYGIGKQPKGLTGRKLSGAATVEHLKPSRYGKTDPLNVRGIPPKLMNRQIEEIDRIASRIPILDESLKRYGLDLYSSRMNGVAYTTMRDGKWRIAYSNETFASRASASAAVSNGIKDGYYMPCSKSNRAVYPTAHELGHILQKSIVENEMGRGYSDVDYETFADSCKAEILKIANELGRSRNDSISKYADKNPRDFFAECFANACCGKVNVYGKSVVEYLKRRGYLDEK